MTPFSYGTVTSRDLKGNFLHWYTYHIYFRSTGLSKTIRSTLFRPILKVSVTLYRNLLLRFFIHLPLMSLTALSRCIEIPLKNRKNLFLQSDQSDRPLGFFFLKSYERSTISFYSLCLG